MAESIRKRGVPLPKEFSDSALYRLTKRIFELVRIQAETLGTFKDETGQSSARIESNKDTARLQSEDQKILFVPYVVEVRSMGLDIKRYDIVLNGFINGEEAMLDTNGYHPHIGLFPSDFGFPLHNSPQKILGIKFVAYIFDCAMDVVQAVRDERGL